MTSTNVDGHNRWSYQVYDTDNTVPRAICRSVLINKDAHEITNIGMAGYISFFEIDSDSFSEHLFKSSFIILITRFMDKFSSIIERNTLSTRNSMIAAFRQKWETTFFQIYQH